MTKLVASEESVLVLDFPTDNLTQLDPDIRIEHISDPSGGPGIKFYKSSTDNCSLLAYSPKLFLVLRIDNSLASGYTLSSYSYNEQLIHSWNTFEDEDRVDNMCYIIFKALNSGFVVCRGIADSDFSKLDINEILIERYRDSIVYRSRNCTRIVNDSFVSDYLNIDIPLCSECTSIMLTNPKKPDDYTFPKAEVLDIPDEEPLHETIFKHDYSSNEDDYETKHTINSTKLKRKKGENVMKKKKKARIKTLDGAGQHSSRIKCLHGCAKSFNDEKNLEKHVMKDHSGPLSCPVSSDCQLKFKVHLGKKMKSHLFKSHNDDTQVVLSCSKCNTNITGVSSMLSHQTKCRRKYHILTTCEQCGQVYKTAAGLSQHIKVAHDKVRYYCDEPGCDKEFNTKNSQLSHKLCVHKNTRAFICSVCGKDYKYRHERRVCENKHAGKFLHHCHLCDKKFNIKRKLDQHLRVHTGEKPYGCPVCAYRCARLDNLNTHTKKSHGMTYKEAESVTGISASTTKITIIPPTSPGGSTTDFKDALFINETVKTANKHQAAATLKLLNTSDIKIG